MNSVWYTEDGLLYDPTFGPISDINGKGTRAKFTRKVKPVVFRGRSFTPKKLVKATLYDYESYAKLKATRDAKIAQKVATRAANFKALNDAWKADAEKNLAVFNASNPGFQERLERSLDLLPDVAAGSLGSFLTDINSKLKKWGSLSESQIQAVTKALDRQENQTPTFWIQGEIGDKITLLLTVERIRKPEDPNALNAYGTPMAFTYICKDSNENCIVYRGRSKTMPEVGETVLIEAIIKKFDEYLGSKQTVIQRPSFILEKKFRRPWKTELPEVDDNGWPPDEWH